MDEGPGTTPLQNAAETEARPKAPIGFTIVSMILTLLIIVVVFGSNFQSSPYTERQLLVQTIALVGAFVLFLANVLAIGFPRLRIPTLVIAVLFLGLLFWNNGI